MFKTRLQHFRHLFEGREAIYIEHGALHVKVSNIRSRTGHKLLVSTVMLADVEVIPTAGFPTGRFCQRQSLVHWEIRGGDSMRVSENIWRAGYGGWSLFFAPRIVQGVLNLAQQFPDTLDAHQRYKQIWRYLYDHDALERTEALRWELTPELLQRIWERVKELLAAVTKNTASSSSRTPATNETDGLQEQLDDARREAQNALAEWRSYETPYYEAAWNEAFDKVQLLEARIPKRKATSGG